MEQKQQYWVKFGNQAVLSHPEKCYGNYWSDHAGVFSKGIAIFFDSFIAAKVVSWIVGGIVVPTNSKSPYKKGKKYYLNNGKVITIENTTNSCVKCSDGIYRYNRSEWSWDQGRITGSSGTDHCLRYPPEGCSN